MSNAAIRRIVWKEAWEQAPLFLTACVSFVVVAIAWAFTAYENGQYVRFDANHDHATLLNMWVNTFAVLTGVLLFVPEKDHKTLGLLQQLPVSSGRIAFTKIIFGVVSLALLTAFCYCGIGILATVTGNMHPVMVMPSNELLEQAIVPIECFMWGVFWSLISKRTLYALLAATISYLLVTYGVGMFDQRTSLFSVSGDFRWWVRIPIIVALVIAITRLSTGWLRDSVASVPAFESGKAAFNSSRDRTFFTSLTWQSFRNYKWLLIMSAIVLILLFVKQTLTMEYVIWIIAVSLVLSAAVGLFTFYFDQCDNSYQFFQQHVEHGRWLWLSRLIPPALISIGAIVAATQVLAYDETGQFAKNHGYLGPIAMDLSNEYVQYYLDTRNYILMKLTVSRIAIVLSTILGAGQYCSMTFRQPVIAWFVGGCLALLVGLWSLLLLICNANLWVFLLPLAFAFFAATWWAAPFWLADKSVWFAWPLVLFAALGVVGGFIIHRATEIPAIPNTKLFNSFTQYESYFRENVETRTGPDSNSPKLKTAQTLYDAVSMLNSDRNNLLENNQDVLRLIHAARKQHDPTVSIAAFWNPSDNRSFDVRVLLSRDFKFQVGNGELEKSLESLKSLTWVEQERPSLGTWYSSNFSEWMGQKHQTANRIRQAIEFFDKSRRSTNQPDLYKHDHFFSNHDSFGNRDYLQMYRYLPWELERTRRIGYQLISSMSQWNQKLKELRVDDKSSLGKSLNDYFYGLHPSRYLDQARTSLLVPYNSIYPNYADVKNIRQDRYLILKLALVEYRLKNGKYPKRLSQLVPEYLDCVPCDPESGGDFFYEPNGLDHGVTWARPLDKNPNIRIVEEVDIAIDDSTLIRSGPFLLPWSSGGGQSLFDCEWVLRDDDHNSTERKKMKCYNLPPSNWTWNVNSDFKLPVFVEE